MVFIEVYIERIFSDKGNGSETPSSPNFAHNSIPDLGQLFPKRRVDFPSNKQKRTRKEKYKNGFHKLDYVNLFPGVKRKIRY